MNRSGAIPSADLLGWGLGLLLIGAPAIGWLGIATTTEFLLFLASLTALVGAGSLVAGVRAFATNHDRMAERYLADLAAPVAGPPAATTPAAAPATMAGDMLHRPTMPPLPGRIVATPLPDEVRIVATPAPPADEN